ncbi:MAG: Na+/H+ antiporter subunit E [Firmicutes bacterium]|nr:Na+/H+ antiporter subunit E [Bacillota bacterium]
MRKRSLLLCALLVAFWLAVSAEVDMQHLLVGAVLAILTVWFWQDLGPRLPRLLSAGELLLLGHCLLTLVRFIIQSNIAVAKTILLSSPPVGPVFAVMRPPIESNWGRVLLANCITITPGTVTVDIDPKTGQFIVHVLTGEAAAELFNWQIIREISHLESWKRRRTEHAMATGRSHDTDSFRALTGDHRSDSH